MNIFKKKIKTYIIGFFILFFLLLLIFASYVFGAYSYSRSLWPIISLKQQKKNIEYMLTGLKFDNKTNRLIKDEWYKNGILHRTNGPAVTRRIKLSSTGKIVTTQHWYKNGKYQQLGVEL